MLKQKQNLFSLIIAFLGIFVLVPIFVFGSSQDKDPDPILDDALFPPDRLEAEKAGRGGARALGYAPYGAGFYDTSEFMIGSVSVAVILPESDGTLDASTENWTAAQEQEIYQEVQAGYGWWTAREPKANLSFKYHFYSGRTDPRAQTSYEPIRRNTYGTNYYPAEQHLWISEIMNKFGYSGSANEYFYQTRSFLHDMRNNDGTDWAFIVFVANSANDFDGTFPDGKFAFSYYGGPFMIMTYNNSGYGISNMDAVAAHEMGHTFYALDQYESAQKDCSLKLGYLNYANQNSEYSATGSGCKSNVASIMRGGVSPYTQNAIDKYAKGQIGWADSNNNGVLDSIDKTPKINISSVVKNSSGATYLGSVSVLAKENKNSYTETLHQYYSYTKNNITNNTIQSVKYRVNQGIWQNAIALDGNFNGLSENFSFTVSKSSNNNPYVEIKTATRFGNTKTVSASGVLIKEKIVAGAGTGGDPKIIIFNNKGKISKSFYAFSKKTKNGVKVAACDLNGDGKDEIIATSGFTWPVKIKIFSSSGKQKSSFRVSTNNFSVNLACGDTNGSGKAKIIIGADYWDEPWVKVLNKKGKVLKKFFAYSKSFKGGVYVVAGDVNGDGKSEIITGPGFGGGPQIRVFKTSGKAMAISFWPYARDYREGVLVAVGDVNDDGKAEIITSPAGLAQARVKVYRYNKAKTILGNFAPYRRVQGIVSIAAGNVKGNGKSEIITAMAAPRLQVKMFKANGKKTGKYLYPFGNAQIGAYLATGRF
ncbi:MAG: hypothetical protein AB1465_03125 [Patescibacteria group bacterium]